MWYGTVKLARDCNVTIIKLLLHSTDLLQPLDVAILKSLRDHWEKVFFRRMNLLIRSKLSKVEFLKIICSEEVWDVSFSEKNVKSGF